MVCHMKGIFKICMIKGSDHVSFVIIQFDRRAYLQDIAFHMILYNHIFVDVCWRSIGMCLLSYEALIQQTGEGLMVMRCRKSSVVTCAEVFGRSMTCTSTYFPSGDP